MTGLSSVGFALRSGRKIGWDAPAFVVAEIGVNHDGSVDTACELITAAAAARADAVKVQILSPERNYAPDHPSYAIYKQANLDFDDYARLAAHASAMGIVFFATPDTASLPLVNELKMPLVKVSSGLLTDVNHLKVACALGVPIVVSTGMSHLDAVVQAVEYCRQHGRNELAVLQCTSLYPAPPETLNLRAIDTLAVASGAVVGFSDHSRGMMAAVAAIACGAKVIEKHITLDRSRPGPEHQLAADPLEFAEFTSAIRSAEAMLGCGAKRPDPAEAENALLFRRCLVSLRDITRGERFTEENVGILRPSPGARGLEPSHYEQVIGLVASQPIPRGVGIALSMLGGLPREDV